MSSMSSKKRKVGPFTGPRRVNDKLIKNLSTSPTSSLTTTTLYSAANNAATVDRVIFTGTIHGNHATAESVVGIGMVVIHHRPNDKVSGMSIAHDAQMWPDDRAVLWQGLYGVCELDTSPGYPINFDVHGMRKLAIGEDIRVYFLSSSASANVNIKGAVTVFAKLA